MTPLICQPSLVLSLVVLIGPLGKASAQEVQWRYDYNAARKEAQEKGLPLILDFGTDACFWCKKLDDTTFRDAAVLAALNSQFIPMKVDANRNPALTEALRVQSYPTLVLAAPDGKILNVLEGYQDATQLRGKLQEVLNDLNVPEWMTRDYDEACRAMTAADFARAVALLKAIAEDGKNRPVQTKARQLLAELEQKAGERLAHARQFDRQGQPLEATDTLTDLLRLYPGTRAAKEADQLLSELSARPAVRAQQRTRRARELLAQAREDYRTQQYVCCVDRCEILATSYEDLPEGAEAQQLLAEIKNNPELMRVLCDTMSERVGGLYLSLAETLLKKGQPQQAMTYLERVLRSFPNTRQAELAQTRLAQLQGQPGRSTNFKNPEP
jgi:thioredoxin-related protein/outer membrane protein assembly factor BamD (BamD/ComL family)